LLLSRRGSSGGIVFLEPTMPTSLPTLKIHKPATPFKDAHGSLEGAGAAYKVVMSMSEEQLRYAMWATLVMLFGHPLSNAPNVVLGCEPCDLTGMRSAHLILAQIGCSYSEPELVEKMRAEVER
jgi:hypothetical protein